MDTNQALHVVIESMPSSGGETWVDILAALLTPVVALLGLYIAYQQYHVNRARLRHELFDRRLAVFQEVQGLLNEVRSQGSVELMRIWEFKSRTAEAPFIFEPRVADFVREVEDQAFKLQDVIEKLHSDHPSYRVQGEERKTIAAEKNALMKWFMQQSRDARDKFHSQMSI